MLTLHRQKGGIGKGSQSRAESAKAGAAAAGKRKRGAAAAVDSGGADSADEQESQQRIRLNAQQKTDLIKLIVEKKKSKEGLSTAGQWRAFEALHGESFGGAKLKKFWDTLHRNWKTVNDYHNSTGKWVCSHALSMRHHCTHTTDMSCQQCPMQHQLSA
jgi:hypothetical protein